MTGLLGKIVGAVWLHHNPVMVMTNKQKKKENSSKNLKKFKNYQKSNLIKTIIIKP